MCGCTPNRSILTPRSVRGDVVQLLVALAGNGTPVAKEQAAGALRNLARNNETNKEAIVKAGFNL